MSEGTLMTVKGIKYSICSLLADVNVGLYEGGQFAIIFLSPIDCHRVFSPLDGYLEEVVHVPGADCWSIPLSETGISSLYPERANDISPCRPTRALARS